MQPISRRLLLLVTASVIVVAVTGPALAAGSNMPWEAPLQSILDSIEGPVARIIAVIISDHMPMNSATGMPMVPTPLPM